MSGPASNAMASNTLRQLAGDGRVLWRMLRGSRVRGAENHAAALQRFYAPQAERYDHFRERLLHGRQELIERLAPPPGGVVVELGGGTGRNLDFFGARMLSLARVEIVDLCPALIDVARQRCARWPEVAVAVEADACTYHPSVPVDCVYFSYSLTMIPDWRAALDNALAMLRPGGTIGVVDFRVSRAHPPAHLPTHPSTDAPADAPGGEPRRHARHGAFTRAFWPRWFGHDGVRLSPEHLHTLEERTEPVFLAEHMGAVPYLAGLRAPYYIYVGRKASR